MNDLEVELAVMDDFEPDQLHRIEPVAPVDQNWFLAALLGQRDWALQPVLFDILTEIEQLVAAYRVEQTGGRMDVQHVAPGLPDGLRLGSEGWRDGDG